MTQTALVFGARGQIGRFLLPRLRAADWTTHAVTRADAPAPTHGLHWHTRELFAGEDLPVQADSVFSLGPLDGFVAWLERSHLRPQRVVAFSSTSAASKQTSSDAGERELAARLQAAEQRLWAWCHQHRARATVLRPTLVYGVGLDRNLSRIAQLAQRWRAFVLPRGATGLRQPVHAEDLAQAAWQAAVAEDTLSAHYDLPGGETLSYRDMVARVLACLDPPARLFEIPRWAATTAHWGARRVGRLTDASDAMLQRLQTDLIYDIDPARRDLDYSPRSFHPIRGMFVSPETNSVVQRNNLPLA